MTTRLGMHLLHSPQSKELGCLCTGSCRRVLALVFAIKPFIDRVVFVKTSAEGYLPNNSALKLKGWDVLFKI